MCEAIPKGARISGAQTVVSLNSRLESNDEEEADLGEVLKRLRRALAPDVLLHAQVLSQIKRASVRYSLFFQIKFSRFRYRFQNIYVAEM